MTYLQIQQQMPLRWEVCADCSFYKLEEIQAAFDDIARLAEVYPDSKFRLVNIVITEIISYGWKGDA